MIDIKAVASFLRVHDQNETLAQHVDREDPPLADAIRRCNVSFAKWRWGTLRRVMVAIMPVLSVCR